MIEFVAVSHCLYSDISKCFDSRFKFSLLQLFTVCRECSIVHGGGMLQERPRLTL